MNNNKDTNRAVDPGLHPAGDRERQGSERPEAGAQDASEHKMEPIAVDRDKLSPRTFPDVRPDPYFAQIVAITLIACMFGYIWWRQGSESYKRLQAIADTLYNEHNYDQAAEYYVKALSKLDSSPFHDAREEGALLYDIGDCFLRRKRYSDAIAYLSQAMAINKNVNPDSDKLLDNLCDLGLAYYDKERYRDAIKCWEPAAKLALKLHSGQKESERHLWNAAICYDVLDQDRLALPYYEQVVVLREKYGMPDAAAGLVSLGECYERLKMDDKALSSFQRVVQLKEKKSGKDSPSLVDDLTRIVTFCTHRRRYTDAEDSARRILSIREKQFGQSNPESGKAANTLAVIYHQQGRLSEAEPLYLRAMTCLQDNKEKAASLMRNYAKLLRANNRSGLAKLYEERADEAEGFVRSASSARGTILENSTDQSAVNYSAFMADVQGKIKDNWHPIAGTSAKRVVVAFDVTRDGTIGKARIERSSGDTACDQAALNALKNLRLSPLPDGAPEKVSISFTFDYTPKTSDLLEAD